MLAGEVRKKGCRQRLGRAGQDRTRDAGEQGRCRAAACGWEQGCPWGLLGGDEACPEDSGGRRARGQNDGGTARPSAGHLERRRAMEDARVSGFWQPGPDKRQRNQETALFPWGGNLFSRVIADHMGTNLKSLELVIWEFTTCNSWAVSQRTENLLLQKNPEVATLTYTL